MNKDRVWKGWYLHSCTPLGLTSKSTLPICLMIMQILLHRIDAGRSQGSLEQPTYDMVVGTTVWRRSS